MFHFPTGPMGFERLRPARMRADLCDPLPAQRRYLGDYSEFTSFIGDDVDSEHATWPEMIDQRRLSAACGRYAFDDAEQDDDAGGNVTDEPHDARQEDGI